MTKTPKQLDAEIEEALELSAYALHVRNEEAAALRRSGYQKLSTGIARGASYEIYGDKASRRRNEVADRVSPWGRRNEVADRVSP